MNHTKKNSKILIALFINIHFVINAFKIIVMLILLEYILYDIPRIDDKSATTAIAKEVFIKTMQIVFSLKLYIYNQFMYVYNLKITYSLKL